MPLSASVIEGSGLMSGGVVARFSLVGIANTLIHIAIAGILAIGLGVPKLIAWWIAFSLVTLFGYVAHRNFSFRSDRPHRDAIIPFVLVVAVSQVLGSWLYLLFSRLLPMWLRGLPPWFGSLSALVGAAGITAIVSFVGLALVFRRTGKQAEP